MAATANSATSNTAAGVTDRRLNRSSAMIKTKAKANSRPATPRITSGFHSVMSRRLTLNEKVAASIHRSMPYKISKVAAAANSVRQIQRRRLLSASTS